MATDPTPVKVRQNKKKTVIFITAAMLILAIAAGIGVKWYRDVQIESPYRSTRTAVKPSKQ